MSIPTDKPPTPKWALLLFLGLFIASAAWGGYVLAKNAQKRAAPKGSDAFEDRSLFGR